MSAPLRSPGVPDPYARPASADATPRAIFAFRIYAGAMAFVCGASLVLVAWRAPDGGLRLPMLAAFGALALLYGAAAFVPRTPWGWSLALVAIALGLPSLAIVVALPLALAWRSPLVKAAFRRI